MNQEAAGAGRAARCAVWRPMALGVLATVLAWAGCVPGEARLDPTAERAIYQAVLVALAEREAAEAPGAVMAVSPHTLAAWEDEITHETVVAGVIEWPSASLGSLLGSGELWTACAMVRLSCDRNAHPRYLMLSDVILTNARDGVVVVEVAHVRGDVLATDRLVLRVRKYLGEWNVVSVRSVPSRVSVRDSAGVTIIENHDSATATLGLEYPPALRIG